MKIRYKTTYWWTGWVLYWLQMSSGMKTTSGTSAIQRPMTSVLHRHIRQLSYPEDSEMGIFFALAVPLDDPISTKPISVAFFFEAVYKLAKEGPDKEAETDQTEHRNEKSQTKRFAKSRRRPIDRRTIYSMLESKFESIGFPGRPCLLRAICDTARHSLHHHNGLIGDLFRITFTPSSSIDEGLPDEFTDAENQVLLNTSDDCGTTYSLCPFGIYDYIAAAEYE